MGLIIVGQVEAHPVSLTSALVNVEEDRITMELRVMVEDLVLYHRMNTDQEFSFSYERIWEEAREHERFLLRHIHLRDGEGRRLEGRVEKIDMGDVPEEGVHIEELMAHSMVYYFEYELPERIEFLAIMQEFGGENAALPAEMDVQVFHHGVFVESAPLPHRTGMTVELDWEAGFEDVEDQMEVARERMRERREQQLGITSYSAVYSYIYITDHAVRHEMLVPLLTFETWLPLERENPDVMTIAEQRAARAAIFAFFRENNPVDINGVAVEPELERLSFYGPDIRDFALRAPERDVSVYSARVGVILSFPTDEPPVELKFGWNYYDERLQILTPRVYPFEEGRINAVVDYHRPIYEWRGEEEREGVALLSVPVPEAPPVWRFSILSVFAGMVCILLLVLGMRRRAGFIRRVAYFVLAVGFAVVVYYGYPHARVSISQPFVAVKELDEEEAGRVFEVLQKNIYRAFEYRDEERIYDALEKSVAGQLLEDLYLQIRRSLQSREDDGTIATVSAIEILDGGIEPGGPEGGFVYRSQWTVTGTLEHWGHVHTRQNRYDAVFTVEPGEEGWRITHFEPFSEEPVMMQLRMRE